MKTVRIVLWIQSIYYFLTALWAIIDINSFMWVTGPKTDVWLVKTVAVLLLAISLSLFAHLFTKSNKWPVIILCAGCCIFLAFIDFYYAGKHTISRVYFLDGIAEIILFLAWLLIIFKIIKVPSSF